MSADEAPAAHSSLVRRASQAVYRVGQFWRGLRAQVTKEEMAAAAAVLPAAARPLFARLPVDARRHSLDVLDALRRAGWDDPDLAVAALLHDAGKLAAADAGVRIGLWLRGPLVLLEAFAPRLLARMAEPEPRAGWRHALYVHLDHPAIGAAWARAAGCSERACWLIAHHQETLPAVEERRGELLAALRWADNRH